MAADDIERYHKNFTALGFKRFDYEGVVCSNTYYNHPTGATVSSLATLTTGAMPETHGIVSSAWFDYTTLERVELTHDPSERATEFDVEPWGDSATRLIAPTLTQTLIRSNLKSRTLTMAINAESAIVMNGGEGLTLWIDPRSCRWASSTAYLDQMPFWVSDLSKRISQQDWSAMYPRERYINTINLGLIHGSESEIIDSPLYNVSDREWRNKRIYESIAYTPYGNKLLLDSAWDGVKSLNLGGDGHTDILNLVLDTAGNIASYYGSRSIEMEDMYYQLDRDFGRFVESVRSWVKGRDVLFTLTSDHGTTPYYDEDKRFNSEQFIAILNSYIGAKYGSQEWVLGYENRSIYLNRELINSRKLDIAQLQDDIAAFAIEFRGVSSAMTATALRNSYFAGGHQQAIQSGFYGQRSGDVVITLMPEWIEERGDMRSLSGSVYGYDNHVPLYIWGSGVAQHKITRQVEVRDIAPTLAKIVEIECPLASSGRVIEEIIKE